MVVNKTCGYIWVSNICKNNLYEEHFKFFVIEDGLDDLDLRLKKEASLINLFKKLSVNVINDFIPNIHSLF